MPIQSDLEAVRALAVDLPELERLRELHERFDIFETVSFLKMEGRMLGSWPSCSTLPEQLEGGGSA